MGISERAELITPESRKRALLGLAVGCGVTALLAVLPRVLPERYGATAIGGLFLAATWLFVWRKDDVTLREHGLELGGLVVPGTHVRQIALRGARAAAFALAIAAVIFVPFAIGFTFWFRPKGHYTFPFTALTLGKELALQVALVAFPEEAFYRGFLQTSLSRSEGPRVRLLGAQVGASILVTSLLFAIGHFATIPVPTRLAVFFPSLLFGWLRVRTGGIGAAVFLHAFCNVFSESLGRGFGLY